MVRERGEGGSPRPRKAREARAPGRWRAAAGHLIGKWLVALDGNGGIRPSSDRIVTPETYLDFNGWLLDFMIGHYGFQPDTYGNLTTAQWEKIRAPYVRTLFSYDEWRELAPQVLADYVKTNPVQAKIPPAPPPGAPSSSPPPSPQPPAGPAIVGPKQTAPCTACFKTPTWRVSIPGETFLKLVCAVHLQELGLEIPKE